MTPAVRRPVAPAAAPVMVRVAAASFSSSSCKSTVTVCESSAAGVPLKSKVMSAPVAAAATPAGAVMSNSALSSPVKPTGTVTGALRTPPLKVTVKSAVAASSTEAAVPEARAMVTVMGSSSATVVVCAAPVAVRPCAAASATLTCTVKVSAPSFRSSPAMVRVKLRLASMAAKVTVPLRSEAAAKSASAVPPWVTVQVTTVAAGNGRPAKVTVYSPLSTVLSVSVKSAGPVTVRVRAAWPSLAWMVMVRAPPCRMLPLPAYTACGTANTMVSSPSGSPSSVMRKVALAESAPPKLAVVAGNSASAPPPVAVKSAPGAALPVNAAAGVAKSASKSSPLAMRKVMVTRSPSSTCRPGTAASRSPLSAVAAHSSVGTKRGMTTCVAAWAAAAAARAMAPAAEAPVASRVTVKSSPISVAPASASSARAKVTVASKSPAAMTATPVRASVVSAVSSPLAVHGMRASAALAWSMVMVKEAVSPSST